MNRKIMSKLFALICAIAISASLSVTSFASCSKKKTISLNYITSMITECRKCDGTNCNDKNKDIISALKSLSKLSCKNNKICGKESTCNKIIDRLINKCSANTNKETAKTETEKKEVQKNDTTKKEQDTSKTETKPVKENKEPETVKKDDTPKEENKTETDKKPSSDNKVSTYEKEVVRLVNEIRVQNGLNKLTLNEKLSDVAREKSKNMHDLHYFDHTSPTYGSPFDMMKSFGITYRSAGENIAMGYSTPEAVVNAWMNSPGHRANILKSSYTEIGVGYVQDGNYCTQMFIG